MVPKLETSNLNIINLVVRNIKSQLGTYLTERNKCFKLFYYYSSNYVNHMPDKEELWVI